MFFIYVYSSCTVQVLTAESPTSWFAAYSHLLALPTIRGELLWGCCRNPSTHALEHRRATRNYPHISNTLKLFRIKKATLKSFNLSLISPLPVPTTLQVARKKPQLTHLHQSQHRATAVAGSPLLEQAATQAAMVSSEGCICISTICTPWAGWAGGLWMLTKTFKTKKSRARIGRSKLKAPKMRGSWASKKLR